VFYVLGLLTMAYMVTPSGLILGNFLFGLGLGSAGMAVAIGAVSRAAPEGKRTLAIGLVTSLGSFGQFLLVPITQLIILGYGWHFAMIMLSMIGSTMIAVGYGLKGAHGTTTSMVVDSGLGPTLKHAFVSRDYIMLVVGFFVCGLHLVFITTHLPVYLQDNGIEESIASWALSLIGLFNIFGAIFFGWIGGKMANKVPLALIYLSRTIIISLFITMPVTATSALLFGMAMGFFWLGTIPLTSGLIGTFFGPRYMATLYGFVFLSHQLGSFLGAWLGGKIYDSTGSYDLMWDINLAAGFGAFVIHLLIRERAFPVPTPAPQPS